MAKDEAKPSETLTVTSSQLDAMIKAGVEAGLAAAEKQHRANVGLESMHVTQEERTHAILGTPIPKRECLKTMLYPCRNPRNGAEFTAVVTPSNKWKEGRCVNLIDYRYPADLETRSGQRVRPDGLYGGTKSDMTLPLVNGDGLRGPFLPTFLQWIYDTYGKADRGAFQGQSAELLPTIGEPTEWKPESTARTAGDAGIV